MSCVCPTRPSPGVIHAPRSYVLPSACYLYAKLIVCDACLIKVITSITVKDLIESFLHEHIMLKFIILVACFLGTYALSAESASIHRPTRLA